MAGEVKRLIDELMRLRTKGNSMLEPFVRVNLMLSGIDPNQYTADSPSDPDAEQKVRKMIDDFRGTSTDGAS
jgi:hypothetical protein